MKLMQRLRSAWGQLWATGGQQLSPDSDLWYQHLGYQTATGLRVSPESAMRVAAVYACVRVVSETIASLPLIVYRSLPDGKERATDHPLYKVLHDSPNQWQTSYEFWEMLCGHLELRGNAFARKLSGPDGAIEQLIPLHPDRVNVFRKPNGELRYQVRSFYTTETQNYEQFEIFHLRGLSTDGMVGLSTVGVGAETISCGAAAQEFAARFFENDSTPSGVLMYGKELSEAAYERVKKSWREQHSGISQHSISILEQGMSYQNIGLTNADAQLLEARQFSRGDISSLFRVPPHKIGDLSRATFSNIEQQNIEFATDCIRPRLVRLERRINKDLLEPLALDGDYFCEFLMDALMRGDLKSRYEAYSVGINAGFLVRNEARRAENYNPIPGLDAPLMPLNLAPVGENGALPPAPMAPDDATGTGGARLKQFIVAAADRVYRKELRAVQRAEGKEYNERVEELLGFYALHGQYVAETLHINADDADAYARRNCAAVLTYGARALDNAAEELTAMAMSCHGERVLPIVKVNVEPAQVNLAPNITVAPAPVSVQPMDVNMTMLLSQPQRTVTAKRGKDGTVIATLEETRSVTATRGEDRTIRAKLEDGESAE